MGSGKTLSSLEKWGEAASLGSLRDPSPFPLVPKENTKTSALTGTPHITALSSCGAQKATPPRSQSALPLGIEMYAVGIGKAIEEELQEIASEPATKHLFYAEDFSSMGQISAKLKQGICEGARGWGAGAGPAGCRAGSSPWWPGTVTLGNSTQFCAMTDVLPCEHLTRSRRCVTQNCVRSRVCVQLEWQGACGSPRVKNPLLQGLPALAGNQAALRNAGCALWPFLPVTSCAKCAHTHSTSARVP